MSTIYQIQSWFDTGQLSLPDEGVSLVFQKSVGAAPLFPGQVLTLDINGDLISADPTTGDVIGVKFDDATSLPGVLAKYMPQGPVAVADWTQATGAADLVPGSSYFLWLGGTMKTTLPAPQFWAIKVGNAISERVLSVTFSTRIAP